MIDGEFYRKLLTADGAGIYSVILDGLRNRDQRIHISRTPAEIVNEVIAAVLRDYPEIAWTCGNWRGQPKETSLIVPEYTLVEEEIDAFQNELLVMREAVREILELPEQDRVRWAYDFVLDNVVYDLSAAHSQDAYGVFMEGHAVCRGIAKGVQLLLKICGVNAITGEGSLNEGALHIWNIVSLADGNYHLDVTMGYPMFSPLYTRLGLSHHRYAAFCVSDRTLRRTHSWDADSIPISCDRDLKCNVSP